VLAACADPACVSRIGATGPDPLYAPADGPLARRAGLRHDLGLSSTGYPLKTTRALLYRLEVATSIVSIALFALTLVEPQSIERWLDESYDDFSRTCRTSFARR